MSRLSKHVGKVSKLFHIDNSHFDLLYNHCLRHLLPNITVAFMMYSSHCDYQLQGPMLVHQP